MNRHELREKAMITIYQDVLVKRDLKELMEDTFQMRVEEIDPYFCRVVQTAVNKQEQYKGYINRLLKGWTYDRLGNIEKAILLLACAEFDLKKIEAPVIIDEAVRLAKKYGDPDSYKMINRVLDII